MPFYKKDNTELLVAPTRVEGPGFSLDAETHTDHVYPVDGWYWFDNLDAAMVGMSSVPNNGIPTSVTMRQARLALLKANLLADVNVAISQAPEEAKIEWEYATEIARSWPILLVLQNILGWSNETLDNLFIEAAKL